jgi:hypothetical protein
VRLRLAETGLDLDLLRDLESVVDFDSQLPNGAFELRVPQEQAPSELASELE